jgi:hypothetical protein
MSRLLVVWAIFVVLAGCSTVPATPNPFVPYQLVNPAQSGYAGKKAYRLGTVKVSLKQAQVNEKFPDEKELEKIFSSLVQEGLEQAGIAASQSDSGIDLDVEIKYTRTFTGEEFGFSKGFAGSRFSYNADLKCDPSVCARYQSPEYVVTSGFVGNLLKIGKNLTATGTPQDEQAEIATYAKGIVKELPR